MTRATPAAHRNFGPLALAGPADDVARPPRLAVRTVSLGWVLALLTMALAVVLALAGCQSMRDGADDAGAGAQAPSASNPDDPVSSDDLTDQSTQPATPSADPGEPVTADLTVTVDATGEGAVTAFHLTCEPVGGDHPAAAAACAAIAAAGGAAAFEPTPADVACTEQWGGAQTATVEGTVGGTAVSADFDRTNGCEISRWDALAPLFGPGELM